MRTSTSSITGVPKPFKFLKPHYNKIKEMFKIYNENDPLKVLINSFIFYLEVIC